MKKIIYLGLNTPNRIAMACWIQPALGREDIESLRKEFAEQKEQL